MQVLIIITHAFRRQSAFDHPLPEFPCGRRRNVLDRREDLMGASASDAAFCHSRFWAGRSTTLLLHEGGFTLFLVPKPLSLLTWNEILRGSQCLTVVTNLARLASVIFREKPTSSEEAYIYTRTTSPDRADCCFWSAGRVEGLKRSM